MTIKHGLPADKDFSIVHASETFSKLPPLEDQPRRTTKLLTSDELEQQTKILEAYTPREQSILKRSLDILSVLGKYLSKDFDIPVLLGKPGEGWYWNFKENRIFVDPEDILTKPDAYLRFVIAHEAAHRRITRIAPIPDELWKQPGYPFMTNAIEDPRINNFITDLYPVLRTDRNVTYTLHAEFEKRAQEKAAHMLGYQPRFVTAGFQYISQWFRKERGEEFALPDSLEPLVREVLLRTLNAAEESWNYYPSGAEERTIQGSVFQYARRSFEINRDSIWPEFKRLIDADLADQRVVELLEELGSEKGKGEGTTSSELSKSLSDAEREALERALEAGALQPGGGGGRAIPLDSLPDELRQKLSEFFDGMSEEDREKWTERARNKIRKYEEQLTDDLDKRRAGEAPDDDSSTSGPGSFARQSGNKAADNRTAVAPSPATSDLNVPGKNEDDILAAPDQGPEAYRRVRNKADTLIHRLADRLQSLFTEKKQKLRASGYRSGRSIDVGKRIREVGKSISPVQSQAFERKTKRVEHDYAVTLVMDLSSSMVGDKIQEAFRALVIASEALERVGVRFEILGFNSALHVYHEFGNPFDQDTKNRLGGMLKEVKANERANNTDDGWTLAKASERLEAVKAKKRIIIMCCDGISNQSAPHNQPEYRLENVLKKITQNTEQLVVGVGLGSNTQKVVERFPFGVGNINAEDFPEALGVLLEEVLKAA